MVIQEKHIIKSIQSYYRKRLIPPLIFIAIIGLLLFFMPIKSLFFPKNFDETCSLEENYASGEKYGNYTLHGLYFTGYTSEYREKTLGYYYYTVYQNRCVIVLLSPETCNQGEPGFDELTVKCRMIKSSSTTDQLIGNLAQDLYWSVEGIKSTLSDFILSEPAANGFGTTFFQIIFVCTSLYAIGAIVLCLFFLAFPQLSIPVLKLRLYGNPTELLAQAEEELITLPQLVTGDMYITQHFFIETSLSQIAIVPIDKIIWVYKYSTLHHILWHHFAISYTLHINAEKRQYINCPKNAKSDIDGIMDYLSEANHNILIGFTEENRIKVEELQGDKRIIKSITSFLSKKV